MPTKDVTRARASRRKHYRANKAQYVARALAKKAEIQQIIRDAKNVPCADCGVKYPPYVMDFDHQGDKLYTVSMMTNCGNAEKVRLEIAKCQVVCSNCHRERTHGSK